MVQTDGTTDGPLEKRYEIYGPQSSRALADSKRMSLQRSLSSPSPLPLQLYNNDNINNNNNNDNNNHNSNNNNNNIYNNKNNQ